SLLNPSAFISNLRGIFPGLQPEFPPVDDRTCEHSVELIPALLKTNFTDRPESREAQSTQAPERPWADILAHPAIAELIHELQQLRSPDMAETVVSEQIAKLYGPALRTSVSRLEQFAACPFK